MINPRSMELVFQPARDYIIKLKISIGKSKNKYDNLHKSV